jgi:hypothetical protein
MKNLMLVCFAIMLFAACKNDEAISSCLEAKFEEMKALPNALSIRKQKVHGETHYWFNDGTLLSDGVEYILNGKCDTVCYTCVDCPAPACLGDYKTEAWKVVWEK